MKFKILYNITQSENFLKILLYLEMRVSEVFVV